MDALSAICEIMQLTESPLLLHLTRNSGTRTFCKPKCAVQWLQAMPSLEVEQVTIDRFVFARSCWLCNGKL